MTRSMAVVFALSLSAVGLRAQEPVGAGLAGRITADTTPLRGAVIRATLGSRTLEVRSGDDGEFRIARMEVGTWVLSVRRVGYVPVVDTVVVGELGARRDYRLKAVVTALDPVLVESRWVGVRGLVVDARTQRPLAGAKLQLTGGRTASIESDAEGRFSIERIAGSDVIVRARRTGYATRIATAQIPKEGYAQMEIAMDTLLRPRSEVMEGDLDSRLRWAPGRVAIVSYDDLQGVDAPHILSALLDMPSVRRKALAGDLASPSVPKCWLLDGFPLEKPLESIPPQAVDFVEVYAIGTEFSGTLAMRFRQGRCAKRTWRVDKFTPLYIAIWTRGR